MKLNHLLLYSWCFFSPQRLSVYKCKVLIIMITFRLNVILTRLQETQKFADSHWNAFPPGLTSPF